MRMHFIGRKKELSLLSELYNSEKTEFLPVYGRRRVGKSELLLRFVEDKTALYFLGKQAPAELQRKAFLTSASRAFDLPWLAEINTSTWRQAFEVLAQNRPEKGKKWVLVLDEFQWLVETSPELPSVLQEFLDRDWKQSGDMFLIICGSYIGFMEREVLGSKSPLYGRRSGQMKLKPFSYREAAQFHPTWSVHDQAKVYFLCGGIPFYLNFFDANAPISQSICDHYLAEYGALREEPEFLLREELREVHQYNAVLRAIADGNQTAKKIAKASGIPNRNLPYYQNKLIELGYVAKHYPVTGIKPSPQKVRYILEDPMLRFWFRFIYPELSYLRQTSPEHGYQTIVAPQLDAYFGHCFERLCREALALEYSEEKIPVRFETGSFWNAETQIDVIGYRNDDRTDVGECKWGKVDSIPALLRSLEQKIAHYPNARGATLRKMAFTRHPLKNAPREIVTRSLEDLYKG